jgi:hypothetical protein
MSTDNSPAVRKRVTDLTTEERAQVAHDMFLAKAKGQSIRSLSRQHGLSEFSVRKLLSEYGAYLQQTRGFSKEANIAAYDYILEKASEIIENPQNYSVLLQAKGYEAFIQAATRKDKLLGHEAPTHNINTKGETLADMVTRMYGQKGENEDESPADATILGMEEEDEIEDAEVVYGED